MELAPEKTGEQVSCFRWVVLAALFLITVLNYVDRQTLSIMAPQIQADLHLSDVAYGHIVTAFLAAYTLSYLLSGPLSDRLGARKSMMLFAGWWSIAEILPAIFRSAIGLGGSRMLLGLGEAGNYVAAPKAIRQWFSTAERGVAIGIYTAGATIGASIAAPLISVMSVRYGWTSVFVCTGVAGLLWLIPWWLVSKPRTVAADVPVREPEEAWGSKLSKVLAESDTWKLMGIRFLTDPVLYFYLFWFPKYFMSGPGGRPGSLWCIYLSADLGAVSCGMIARKLMRNGVGECMVQRRILMTCATMMLLSLAAPRLHTPLQALGLAAILLAAHMAWLVMVTNIVVDRFPEALVGTASGVIASGSGLGGLLSAELIGMTVQGRGYAAVFVALAFLHPIALLLVCRLRRFV
jgi:ACS family hexuronate transporter-like MFS transporter